VKFAEYKLVKINELMVDYIFQRSMHTKNVKEMSKDFEPMIYGALTVCVREENLYSVLDGSHRFELAKIVGIEEVPCLVLPSMSIQSEARLFNKLNGTSIQVTPLEHYKADLIGDDQESIEISKIVKKNGFIVGKQSLASGQTRNIISAIATIRWIYRKYGAKTLDKTLYIIYGAWDNNKESVSVEFLKGVAKFAHRHYDLKNVLSYHTSFKYSIQQSSHFLLRSGQIILVGQPILGSCKTLSINCFNFVSSTIKAI